MLPPGASPPTEVLPAGERQTKSGLLQTKLILPVSRKQNCPGLSTPAPNDLRDKGLRLNRLYPKRLSRLH